MHTARNWPFWNICVIILWFGTFLFFSPPLPCQPVIGHNTDRSTADKAVIITLSPLTDKQACLSGGTEEKPLTLWNDGKKDFFFNSKTAAVFCFFFATRAFDKRICALGFPSRAKQAFFCENRLQHIHTRQNLHSMFALPVVCKFWFLSNPHFLIFLVFTVFPCSVSEPQFHT